jgi:hypothetical protein
MGQSVNQQLGLDPEYIRSQILQRREQGFQQIQNPFQQAAARLGTILGGGVANLANDRGFFEVSDPLLTRVTQIQGIYNDVAQQVDPAANPEQFFKALSTAYKDAGMGQQALLSMQEAQKARVAGMDVQLKETQLYEKNPELLAGRITAALESGNEPEATRLANLNARLTEDRELKLEKARTDIAKDKAYIAYQNKLASDEKFEYKPVDPNNPLAGNWKFDKSGRTDPQYVPVPADLAAKFAPPTKDGKKTDKERAPLSSFSNTTASATAPAAATTQTTWSGVPIQPKAAVPLTAMQERDFAIQRAYPTLVISTMDETTKAQLAQQLGL